MDIEDYGDNGFIGKKEYIDTPSLDLPNWQDNYTTFKAAFSVYKTSLSDFIIESYNMFIDKNEDGSLKKTIGISEAGKILFCDAVDNVYSKMLTMERNFKQFWNCLPIGEDKVANTAEYVFTKLKLLPRNFLRYDFEMNFTEPVYDNESPVGTLFDVPYVIDYTNYQTLTPQIYKDYINSVTEFTLAVKKLVNTVTGTKI